VPLIINPRAFDYWYRPKIESILALLVIAGIALFAKVLIQDSKLHWERNTLTIPILCYATAAVISTMFSINVGLSLLGDPLRVEGLGTVLIYQILVFLFINQVNTERLAGKLFFCLIVCATLVSLYALFQYFFYNPTAHFIYKYFPSGKGVGSTIGNPNFLGKYLVLIIPIIFALCLGEDSKIKFVSLLLSFFFCFAALMATFTRASWLGVLCGIVVLLFLIGKNSLFGGKKQRLVIIGIMVFLIVILFNNYSPSKGLRKTTPSAKKVSGEVVQKAVASLDISKGRGVVTRLYVWGKTFRLIKDKPWFGYGLETFQIAFDKYNDDYRKRFNDFIIVDRAHNNYIDTAFALGIIGLGAYCAIIISFLAYLFGLLKQTRNNARKLFYSGIFAGYCAYLINDFFIFSVVSVSPTFWALMGLTVAAGRIDMINMKRDETGLTGQVR
jgi:putative inorganic carbon (HCO3(-)) transporter